MTEKAAKKALDEQSLPRRRGRQRVGIIPDVHPDGKKNIKGNCVNYRAVLADLVADTPRFRKSLREAEKIYDAKDAYDELLFIFRTSDPAEKIAATQKLDQFCLDWLSDYGWKRLQANARDRRYQRGAVIVDQEGDLVGRESKKQVKLDESTARRLTELAGKQKVGGKKLSITKFVDQLMEFWNEHHKK